MNMNQGGVSSPWPPRRSTAGGNKADTAPPRTAPGGTVGPQERRATPGPSNSLWAAHPTVYAWECTRLHCEAGKCGIDGFASRRCDAGRRAGL
ncbi:hypothetical protein BD779DRAFT_1551832 [Infundibulicybe gibba]|nr:hypothetical protein BD779DRAFT_1551832 [Infundibulicybe gibba]